MMNVPLRIHSHVSVLPYMEEVGECREPEPQPQVAAAFSGRGQDKLE